MATENPKISIYVPKIIYERFEEFKKERKISFSQAGIQLFAEYFGINLADSSTQNTTGGLLEKIVDLQQVVTDLKQSYEDLKKSHEDLTEKVEHINSTSIPPRNISENYHSEPVSVPQNGSLISDVLSTPLIDNKSIVPSEPPIVHYENKNGQEDSASTLLSREDSSLPSLENKILEPPELDKDKSGLPNNPSSDAQLTSPKLELTPSNCLFEIKIKQPVLSKRLKVSDGSINVTKAKCTTEKFAEWSSKKDSDGISWYQMKEGRSVYYYPDANLTDDQKNNLLLWLKEYQSQEQV